MTCLETTFIIDLLRGKEEIKNFKDELDKSEIFLSVASPTIMEIWMGALMSKLSLKEKEKINELLSSLVVLSLEEKSAKEAGEIEAELLKSGAAVDIEDVMIAGICRANGEKIVTRDQDYMRISGLKIMKY